MTKTTFATSPMKSARRFKELATEFAEELGGADRLTTVEMAMCNSAASLLLRAEQMQEAMQHGEFVKPEALVRLNSEARRALTILRRRKGQRAHFNGADPLTDLKKWADAT